MKKVCFSRKYEHPAAIMTWKLDINLADGIVVGSATHAYESVKFEFPNLSGQILETGQGGFELAIHAGGVGSALPYVDKALISGFLQIDNDFQRALSCAKIATVGSTTDIAFELYYPCPN